MTLGLRLGEVEPRERAGAQTGRKYEYQYERTARAALDLLVDELKRVCVYCDWLDDFVVEVGASPTRYIFNQVKGRNLSEGLGRSMTSLEYSARRRKGSRRSQLLLLRPRSLPGWSCTSRTSAIAAGG
jgi:hypothetical protein